MHAGSRICLGKLRMSTCEGRAEDRAKPPFFPCSPSPLISPPEKRGTRGVTGHVRVEGLHTPLHTRKVPPCLLRTYIRHGV